jgi:hypothetical protein
MKVVSRAMLVATVLCSPAHALTIVDNSAVPLSEDQKAKITRALAVTLLDPFTAVVKIMRPVGSNQYCGIINAKNSFGAYTGIRWVLFNPASETVYIMPTEKEAEDISYGMLNSVSRPLTEREYLLKVSASLKAMVATGCGIGPK